MSDLTETQFEDPSPELIKVLRCPKCKQLLVWAERSALCVHGHTGLTQRSLLTLRLFEAGLLERKGHDRFQAKAALGQWYVAKVVRYLKLQLRLAKLGVGKNT
jgi:uncharacterized protein YbaR (Trm112 family)